MLPSLLDLSSRIVAQIYPFQLIEDRYKIIPEPIIRKIIHYAFPRDVEDILVYSEGEWRGEEWEVVGAVLQVGFLCSGTVRHRSNPTPEKVRLIVDRCKITSVSCTCTVTMTTKSAPKIFWCDHVVAVAMHRIKFPNQVELRVPISDTLTTLTRPQLQKLVQYLLHDHPQVLPSCQKLADRLLESNAEINEINGAPDITAGGNLGEENWAFNENECIAAVKGERGEEVVMALAKKILTMTTKSDSNGPRILTLITQTFLASKPPNRTPLWDQLLTLWQITAMTPLHTPPTRHTLYGPLLTQLSTHPSIPLDENSTPLLKPVINLLATDYTQKTSNLRNNCLRVQSLSAHGHKIPAKSLALKILKTTKKLQNFDLDYDLVTAVFKTLDNEYSSDWALLNLGQCRPPPPSLYMQEKWLRTEESFINLLKPGNSIIEKYCSIFLEKAYLTSCLPLYSFGIFLYKECKSESSFQLAVKYLSQQIPNLSIQTSLEHQQVNLALLLISYNKSSKSNLEILLKTLSSCVKSTSSLFRIAQESSRLEETRNLTNLSFKLGLSLLKSTLKQAHRRRWDIVRWVMNISLSSGFGEVLYLLENWEAYFSASEAVGTVASQFLSRGTGLRLGLGFQQQQRLGEAARGVGLGGMRVDPGNCSLNALTICESDPTSFETAYQIILTSAKQQNLLNCQQIFTIARYMEHRGYPLRAYKLAAIAIAIGHLHIPFNQETHTSISDIHWTTTLAQSLGDTELSNLLPLIISNIQCASVLSEILKRAAMEPPRKCHRNGNGGSKIYARLKLLVEATINSYVTTIHNRLSHISPRHYADFVEFLGKARECFMFSPGGGARWNGVIGGIKREYKGKKKLVVLVSERFG